MIIPDDVEDFTTSRDPEVAEMLSLIGQLFIDHKISFVVGYTIVSYMKAILDDELKKNGRCATVHMSDAGDVT